MSDLMKQPLHRSSTNSMIGGVCGGLGESFGIDPTIVRLLFVLSMLLPGPQVLIYLVMYVIIPQR
ncbi:PspC domain-containing protein [Corynebacterium choanae]|uniref:DNA-binding transcriptional activator PspC n=1 Tax=Corynebacterium choanae TaxID=1862358 RepID=A0A3G6JAW2_9CORY|nr:PspC domain-containing protein [Corynebacterium choanae]AZA13630.1 DNA-binding transcriptional activator PspC [Corynebacterium choanae]